MILIAFQKDSFFSHSDAKSFLQRQTAEYQINKNKLLPRLCLFSEYAEVDCICLHKKVLERTAKSTNKQTV